MREKEEGTKGQSAEDVVNYLHLHLHLLLTIVIVTGSLGAANKHQPQSAEEIGRVRR